MFCIIGVMLCLSQYNASAAFYYAVYSAPVVLQRQAPFRYSIPSLDAIPPGSFIGPPARR